MLAACTLFSAVTLFAFVLFNYAQPKFPFETPELLPHAPQSAAGVDRHSVLLGPPTSHFRDNLRNDTRYITSWISAGWTNDVMTYGNLVYLAMISQRVPIIGPFTPSHIGGEAGSIPFSEVFDLDRLSTAIGMSVVEWGEVKDPASTEIENLGCWSIWQAVQTNEAGPRITGALSQDISYTKAPSWVQKNPGYEHDPHAHFWSIATLTFPEERRNNLGTPQPSNVLGAVAHPDEQVACFDYLYYVCATTSFEYEYDYSPGWRFAVKNFRWTDRLQGIADGYLKRMFGVPEEEPVPPYVGIHIRHGDFINYCGETPKEDCFASLSVVARRVQEVQDEVQERYGYRPERVVMLSDEREPGWWDAVRLLGWYTPDHIAEDTTAKYGRWYPLLIDAVIQSSGIGFVGTDTSTMSVLARRRVQDWHGGAVRTVKWGTPNADDH
ncbi:hypothetical protein HETIRDRAFT_307790 [Heterobasidion irregulare TC 32-1]|uniref:Glycosyltransferase family 23 protein n=1 Tax=Heterobasidion irregulare (strain TC 32-1) TaxID=747525 RepID=W4KMH3_HETIT|nr:uncharacterized protein HETIRDRAFT_307790 [Heterobasidion irregulare TC 32-1]ETW87012.1 hypothetical protein HETIRDRAFT_307790 [Heterobasidion irregulare TC 32-1]